jgi:integrase
MTRGTYRAKPAPGSIGELILAFRQSPHYRDWALNTKLKNERVLSDLMELSAARQVSELRRKDIIAARNSLADTPDAANNWLKCVRVLLDFAVDMEYVPHNVAREKVERLRPKAAGGWRSWHEHEITAYLDHHPLGTLPHRVLTLALYTGAARIDLVNLGWQNVNGHGDWSAGRGSVGAHISDNIPAVANRTTYGGLTPSDSGSYTSTSASRIRYQRQKTIRHEEPVWIDLPIAPPLLDVLTTLPRTQLTFLATPDGHVRSEKALSTRFAEWVRDAGLGAPDENGRHLSLHGLRKAVGRRLAEAGCSGYEIAACLGHRSPKSSEPYTKAFDRSVAATNASAKLGEVWAVEQKVTKLRRTE